MVTDIDVGKYRSYDHLFVWPAKTLPNFIPSQAQLKLNFSNVWDPVCTVSDRGSRNLTVVFPVLFEFLYRNVTMHSGG